MGVIAEPMKYPNTFEKIHCCYGHETKLTISFAENEKEVSWRCDICGSKYCFKTPNRTKGDYMDDHQRDKVDDLIENR